MWSESEHVYIIIYCTRIIIWICVRSCIALHIFICMRSMASSTRKMPVSRMSNIARIRRTAQHATHALQRTYQCRPFSGFIVCMLDYVLFSGIIALLQSLSAMTLPLLGPVYMHGGNRATAICAQYIVLYTSSSMRASHVFATFVWSEASLIYSMQISSSTFLYFGRVAFKDQANSLILKQVKSGLLPMKWSRFEDEAALDFAFDRISEMAHQTFGLKLSILFDSQHNRTVFLFLLFAGPSQQIRNHNYLSLPLSLCLPFTAANGWKICEQSGSILIDIAINGRRFDRTDIKYLVYMMPFPT